MSQEYRRTILIVCEGQRSEPDYFHNLRNEVIKKVSDVYIEILPIPKYEQQEIEKDVVDFKIRRGGRKRQVKKAITEKEPEDYIVEEKYKSQPTCYVRKAQLAYFEKQYSELWAVYDKDGHPSHEEAYLLSKISDNCNKIVNIGFSSVSFEEWILMHFEFCSIPFLKSQCRDENKKVFDCGTNSNENDCEGEKCVVGRIVQRNFLNYNSSKNFEYKEYSEKVLYAFKNALESRDLATDKLLFYNNNPYVSIDRLVFKLTNIEKGGFTWQYEKTFVIESRIYIKITNDDNVTKIEIDNQSEILFIVQKEFLRLIDVKFNVLFDNERKHLEPGNSCLLYSKENISFDDFQYAVFKVNDKEFKILDVVQITNFI